MTPARRKVLNISAVVATVVVLLGGAVVAGKAIMHARGGMGRIQGNTERLKVNEGKIHSIEETVNETHADVRVIRALMEREHP